MKYTRVTKLELEFTMEDLMASDFEFEEQPTAEELKEMLDDLSEMELFGLTFVDDASDITKKSTSSIKE